MGVMTRALNGTPGDFARMILGSVTSVIRRRRYLRLVMAVLPLAVLVAATTPWNLGGRECQCGDHHP